MKTALTPNGADSPEARGSSRWKQISANRAAMVPAVLTSQLDDNNALTLTCLVNHADNPIVADWMAHFGQARRDPAMLLVDSPRLMSGTNFPSVSSAIFAQLTSNFSSSPVGAFLVRELSKWRQRVGTLTEQVETLLGDSFLLLADREDLVVWLAYNF